VRDDAEINVNDPDYDDEILAEIRQIREEFSIRFKGDIDAMHRYYEEQRQLEPMKGLLDAQRKSA